MPFSTNYANNILNYLFAKTQTLSAPSVVYLGLSENDPEADGGVFNELSCDTYARLLISGTSTSVSYLDYIGNANNRAITNAKQINWTKATVDWTQAKGFGLFSAPSGGEPFFYGTLEAPVTCEAGAVALFDPGALKISFPTTDTAATAST